MPRGGIRFHLGFDVCAALRLCERVALVLVRDASQGKQVTGGLGETTSVEVLRFVWIRGRRAGA